MFGVAHETANNSANALAHVKYFQHNNVQASYHQLVDSERIVEIIPDDEIAFHVRRDLDRQTLNLGKANDRAVAISLCRTGSFSEGYDRFVWAWARVCVQNKWNPSERITAHRFEDPQRRSDPHSWLEPNGVSWQRFIEDVSFYISSWNSKMSGETFKSTYVSEATSLPKSIYRDTHPYPTSFGVKKVQEALVSLHFYPDRLARDRGIDGIYGPKTADAIRRFQQVYLPNEVDGIYGQNTRTKLINQLSLIT